LGDSLGSCRSRYVNLVSPELGRAVETILDSLRKSRRGLTITLEEGIVKIVADGRERQYSNIRAPITNIWWFMA